MISNKRQINLLFLLGLVVISALVSSLADAELLPHTKYPDYDFVKCPNDPNIYPEGTDCDGLPDSYNDDADNHDSDEVTEDEEEAMKDAD